MNNLTKTDQHRLLLHYQYIVKRTGEENEGNHPPGKLSSWTATLL